MQSIAQPVTCANKSMKENNIVGLILDPSTQLKSDYYPHAHYVGLDCKKKVVFYKCVSSRTRFVIMVADFQVLWQCH